MRQHRQRIQVSTFPFLAVLLCAMGSLILLLLVIDRRAKVVARAKALRALAQVQLETSAEAEAQAAAQRAEWERRRQRLHEELLQQNEQLLGQLQAVENKNATTTGSLELEVVHNRELRAQLEHERAELAHSEETLRRGQAEASHAAEQTEASRNQLRRLTADLEHLEHTLAELKLARQRQQPLYSLVPYRGKRGDNRKPLYLECAGDALIFHPDHLALRGITLTGSVIREEIERRLAQQRTEIQAAHPKPSDDAYLLMLIRPDGIAVYYRILGALKGFSIDFGYEFIDQDWVLDFSENDDTQKKQPWRVSERTDPEPRPTPQPRAIPVPKWGGPGGTIAGSTAGPLGSPRAAASTPGFAGKEMEGESAGTANGGGGGNAPFSPGAWAGGAFLGEGQRSGVSARGGSSAPGTGIGTVRPFGGRPQASGPMPQEGMPVPVGASPVGLGQPSTSRNGSAQSTDVGPSLAGRQRGSPSATEDGSFPGRGMGEAASALPAGTSAASGSNGPPSPFPEIVPQRGSASNGPGGQPAAHSSPEAGQPSGGSENHGDPGETGPNRGATPLDRFTTSRQPRQGTRGPSVRVAPLVGNRDWILAVECRADGLLVQPSEQHIALNEIANGANGTSPLLELLQRLIARRQATVRPGEPPYRPMIRFRVRPDGLRAYYLAYPVVEGLQVPMSRENIDSAEEKAAERAR